MEWNWWTIYPVTIILLGIAIIVIIVLALRVKVTKKIEREIEQKNYQLRNELQILQNRRDDLSQYIEDLQASYDAKIELLAEHFSQESEALSKMFKKEEEAYKQEYLDTLQTNVKFFADSIIAKRSELDALDVQIADMGAKVAAAVEASRRLQEMSKQQNFYKLELQHDDVQEIARIKEIEPFFRNPEPLNKIVWKYYLERPYTDLVGRVLGNKETVMGIYKITNSTNQMCYIGQAVNVAKRWKEHIRCAIGADKAPNNKLYAAMRESGIENFTFELIEECPQEILNEREQFWQEYFQAKTFGYSMK